MYFDIVPPLLCLLRQSVILMVIRLVSHCHALLLQSAATLLVDLHPCIDGRLGGVLAEYAAHLMEHPKDSGSHRLTEVVFKTELINLINSIFDKITSESSGI